MSVAGWAGGPPFRPHPLLGGFHRMTLASALPRRGPPTVERRLVPVDAETTVAVLCSWQPAPGRPTLVVCHGLTGHADRPPVRGLAASAFAAGWNVCRVNTRNCGGTEHLTPTLYHAGLVDDLAAVVGALVAQGRGPLVLAGFSMGGNVVLKLAATWGAGGPPEVVGVAAVSAPVDLAGCQERLDGDPVLHPYRSHFLRGLRRVVRRKAARDPERWDVAGLEDVTTLLAFDDRFTAPSFGFGDARTYYRRASALSGLGGLRRPALVLHARDDRIVPAEGLLRAARACPLLRLVLSERGGHCGFVGRRAGPGIEGHRWWVDHRILAFSRGLLATGSRPAPGRQAARGPVGVPGPGGS